MELSILDIYRIGKNAVQLFPKNLAWPCLQPQAFRVLQRERGTEIGHENLGAVPSDKDTPFFWSRKWHEFKYNPNNLVWDWPIVTMYEVINEVSGNPFVRGFKRCYTLEIAVLDLYKEDCTNQNFNCISRPVNQIFLDTEIILDSILQYFGNMVLATTSADPVERWYHLDWVKNEMTVGNITNYVVRRELANMLGANNKQMRFTRVERPTQGIFGTTTQVVFCTENCSPIEFDFTLPEFGTLAFEASCLSCGV